MKDVIRSQEDGPGGNVVEELWSVINCGRQANCRRTDWLQIVGYRAACGRSYVNVDVSYVM